MRVTGDLLRFSTEQDNGNSSCDRMDSPGSHGGKPDLGAGYPPSAKCCSEIDHRYAAERAFSANAAGQYHNLAAAISPGRGRGKHELQGLI
jgi:hypothetical protein